MKLVDRADTQGWDFKSAESLHVLDFADAIRQSALDGLLTVWGRPDRNTSESLTRNEPLHKIDPDHWKDFQIDATTLIADENFQVRTYSPGKTRREGFVDLHVERTEALRWLVYAADEFKGQRKP